MLKNRHRKGVTFLTPFSYFSDNENLYDMGFSLYIDFIMKEDTSGS